MMDRRMALTAAVATALLLTSVQTPAAAQNIKGAVTGIVLDAQRAVVPGAAVLVRDVDRERERKSLSDGAGRFQESALEPGAYQVEVKKQGFAPYLSSSFEVQVGEPVFFEVLLQVGEFSTEVEVVSEAPSVLQANDTKQARVFTSAEMNDLPNQSGFAGRNFYTQALTTPGVNYSPLAHRPFAVSGQRPRNNNYMVDSVQINDVESGYIAGRGISEQVISQEAIQGMEVITHNYKAEYGRNSGSIVSLVSKSGSNDYHGSGFWYHNNSALRARNFFESEKAKRRANLAGGTLGGPIIRNRAFFYGNLETYKVRGQDISTFRSLTNEQRAQAVPAVRPLVNLYPAPPAGSPIFASGVPNESDQYTYLIRGDVSLTDKQTLMLRNNFTRNTSLLQNLAGFVGHRVNTNRMTNSITAHHTYTPAASLVNEFRAGFMRFTQFDDALDPLAIGDPAINGQIGFMIVPGLSPGGTISFMGKQQALNVYSLSNDVSWNLGAHAIKLGSGLRRNQGNGGNPNNSFVGTIFFPTVTDFLAGRPLSYTRNIGNPLIGVRRWEWDAYVQDDWRLTPTLTLNLGLRYELYTAPTEQHGRIREQYRFPTDTNNFAPRVGLAWRAMDKTVVRAGWGIFYNALEMDFIGLTRFNPPNVITLSAFRPQIPNLLDRATQAIPSGLVIPSETAATPYSQHLNFTIERELWNPRSTLSVGYVGTFGTRLPRTRQPNGGDNLAQNQRPDPAVGVISRLETSGVSNYHSLQIGFNHRFSDFVLKGAYTYSKFIDDVSEFATTNTGLDRGILPLDETNLNVDLGRSDFDTPHIGTFSFIYRLPWMKSNRFLGGWSLSSIGTLRSGQPFSIYSGTNNLTGQNNNRIHDIAGSLTRDPRSAQAITVEGGLPTALLIEPESGELGTLGRNTESGDNFFNFSFGAHKDFALTERVKVQFRAELFNAFNTTNFSEIDNLLSIQRASGQPVGFNSNFGRYIEAFDPRSAQLTLRIVF